MKQLIDHIQEALKINKDSKIDDEFLEYESVRPNESKLSKYVKCLIRYENDGPRATIVYVKQQDMVNILKHDPSEENFMKLLDKLAHRVKAKKPQVIYSELITEKNTLLEIGVLNFVNRNDSFYHKSILQKLIAKINKNVKI